MSIHFGGSRNLPTSPVLKQVVQAVIQSGQAVHVGCAIGADQQVIQAAMSSPSFLFVFASFASSGAGAWSGSASSWVHAAAHHGASVSWLAGGGLRVPLVGRLMGRSRAALAGCSASVFFLAGPSSRGSLAVAGHAVAAGQPVFVFCPVCPQAPRGCIGQWQSSQLLGFSCWQWQPAAVQQSLF
jgi:predicted Rossmann fold nucleotide-binding protein DprA/Smf involved in DNA uptake